MLTGDSVIWSGRLADMSCLPSPRQVQVVGFSGKIGWWALSMVPEILESVIFEEVGRSQL